MSHEDISLILLRQLQVGLEIHRLIASKILSW